MSEDNQHPLLRLEWRRPEELQGNPLNWRRHPDAQIAGLEEVISEVGWAGCALFNEETGHLLDGHCRKKVPEHLLVDGCLPVLVGRWSLEKERLILATLDPLAEMATADDSMLAELLAETSIENEALLKMLNRKAKLDGNFLLEPGDGEELQITDRWDVLVECETEDEQIRALAVIEEAGFTCRSLIS